MKSSAGHHPQKEQLAAFGLGRLSDEESVWIENHLDQCDECNQTLVSLEDDTFAGVVRLLAESPADRFDFIPDTMTVQNRAVVNTDGRTEGAVKDVDGQSAETLLPRGSGSAVLSELAEELKDHPRYRVVERIGRGGMGDVYRAEHRLVNRKVAIKLINSLLIRHPQAIERFRREVRAAAQLHHPNIVTAFDAEQAGDLHFLVMELVDGKDLASVVNSNGPLAVTMACEFIRHGDASNESVTDCVQDGATVVLRPGTLRRQPRYRDRRLSGSAAPSQNFPRECCQIRPLRSAQDQPPAEFPSTGSVAPEPSRTGT